MAEEESLGFLGSGHGQSLWIQVVSELCLHAAGFRPRAGPGPNGQVDSDNLFEH